MEQKSCKEMEETDTGKIAVGSQFRSYVQLEEALRKYQDQNFIQIFTRESRTLANNKRLSRNKRICNADLKYSDLGYSCLFGVKHYKSKSEGHRIKQ